VVFVVRCVEFIMRSCLGRGCGGVWGATGNCSLWPSFVVSACCRRILFSYLSYTYRKAFQIAIANVARVYSFKKVCAERNRVLY
jgi:hypothetical protein